MAQSVYLTGGPLVLDSNQTTSRRQFVPAHEVMHKDKVVARISARGEAEICDPQFMPYDLYLEEGGDFDTIFNNANEFQHWCASRVLSLDRTHAKAILNTIGASQNPTDRDRASIALSCRCVSLTDVHWVREFGEDVTFAQINLYDNSLNEAIVELSLRGKSLTVTNQELVTARDLAPDLSTKGLFPKAWIRRGGTFLLLKDGGPDSVRRELLASQICQCFDIPQVVYQAGEYDGEPVTQSQIITSKDRSIIPMRAFEVYAVNHDLDPIEAAIRLDPVTYYGMNLLDYLTGNTDRHRENWGVLVDNDTNRPVSLYPLMDFNQCFLAYDRLDGANCLTAGSRTLTQREAAMEAVRAIGLRQRREVDLSIFGDLEQEAQMFRQRLAALRRCEP